MLSFAKVMDLFLKAWYFSSHVNDGVAGVVVVVLSGNDDDGVVVVVEGVAGVSGTGVLDVSCIGGGGLSLGVAGDNAGELSLFIMIIRGGYLLGWVGLRGTG